MIAVYDAILAAHKADAFPVEIRYGGTITKDEAAGKVKAQGIARYIIAAPLDVDSELYKATDGSVKELKFWKVIFARTAKDCVQGLQDWFIRVGAVSDTGIVGIPGHAPWTYSTLSVLKWRPVGSLEQYAEVYGEVFAIEQFTRISIRI